MKTLIKIFLCSFILIFTSHCKKTETNFTIYKFKVAKLTQESDNFRVGGLTSTEVASIKGEANVSVKFYASEVDARTDKNLTFEKTTNSEGFVEFEKKFTDPNHYYIRTASGEFNNLRGSGSTFSLFIPSDGEVAFLTLTPSRLQIQVLNSAGTPLPNSTVTVFPTEDDYNKKTQALFWMPKFPEYGGSGADPSTMSKTTDATGTVKFDNLAPRIFWFSVSGPAPYKNNDGGYYKLTAPLPDSPEIYFVTSVVLKQ